MCVAIQNILTLAKHTFQRKTALDGSKRKFLESEEFLQTLKELSDVMRSLDIHDLGLEQSPSLFPDQFPEHSYKDSEFTKEEDHVTEEYSDELKNTSSEKALITYIR